MGIRWKKKLFKGVLFFFAAQLICVSLSITASAEGTNNVKDSGVSTESLTTESTTEQKTTEQITTEAVPVVKEKPGIRIKIGKKKKATKRYKGSFKKKKGEVYFRCRDKADRKKFKGGFFTCGKYVYHCDKKGRLDRGWKKLGGQYYYFDRDNGKMAVSKTVDHIKIDKYGNPKNLKKDKARIQTYIRARRIMESVTKPTDSKSTKLYKCYKWMEKLYYNQYRTFDEGYKKYPKDWDVVFANDIFKKHQGCCVSEAAAFAYMAKECGYKNVSICSDTGHAWTDIDGRLYDPLFAEAKEFDKNYNSSYWDYRSDPSIKKRL